MTRKVVVHNYWPPRFLTRDLDTKILRTKSRKTRDEDKRWQEAVQMIDPAAPTSNHKWAFKRFNCTAATPQEAETKAIAFYKKRGYRNIKPTAELMK